MSGKKPSLIAVIIGDLIGLLIGVVAITALISSGLQGLHRSVGMMTVGYFVTAAVLLLRYGRVGRSS
jgi:uncharacterized membrane protein